jgi:disulfide bond formation protein DsbB/cytochrome c5
MTRFFDRYSLYIALAAAWTAMLGSLYFSEVRGYVPCSLCWYQRILMYPLAGILAVGLLRRDSGVPYYVLPFSLLGLGLSTYHYLLQKTQIFDSGAVCQAGVPCTTMWINWFGFVTIPFLALTAFVIISAMAFVALEAQKGDQAEEIEAGTPWLAVAGTIVVVAGAIALASLINRPPAAVAENASVAIAAERKAAQSGVGSSEGLDGAALYAGACAVCHGPRMEGVPNLGNALVDNAFVAERSDEELLAFVRAGRAIDDPENETGVLMPPSGGQPNLTDAELLAIIRHMRAGQATD